MLTCEICGCTEQTDTKYADVFGMGVDLVECVDCGTRFYRGDIGADGFYTTPMYDEYVEKSYLNGDPAEKTPANLEMYRKSRWRIFAVAVEQVIRMARESGECCTLFEVGAAWGELLCVARYLGLEVAGCDASAKGPEIAETLGLDIQHAVLQDAEVPKGLDAIICWDMIEHSTTPGADVCRMFAHLRPGGVLLIKTFYDEWHDGRALDLSPTAERGLYTSGYFGPNAHPYHFTLPALRGLLERVGFEVVIEERNKQCGQVTMIARRPCTE